LSKSATRVEISSTYLSKSF